MKKSLVLLGLMVIALVPSVQASGCSGPRGLMVDLINSVPSSEPVIIGEDITTTIHAVYANGDPVSLNPELAGFLWTGSQGRIEFDSVPLVFTGNRGFYDFRETVTADFVNATGPGEATLSVVACSLQDAQGNHGPPQTISSDETLTPSDNSHLVLPQVPRILTATVTESAISTTGGFVVVPSGFLNMASLMLAVITVSVVLIAVILGLRTLIKNRQRQEGLYP